jgi:flagellar basal-body rod protein FlgC
MIHFIPSLPSTTAALDAERKRLDVIAQNIANANTTRALDGHPYQRQQVIFENVLQSAQAKAAGTVGGPVVARIQKDTRPGPAVYQPGHPDADPSGIVHMPNVTLHEEMADMIVASRTYEANLAVLKNGRTMATQALSIGKR